MRPRISIGGSVRRSIHLSIGLLGLLKNRNLWPRWAHAMHQTIDTCVLRVPFGSYVRNSCGLSVCPFIQRKIHSTQQHSQEASLPCRACFSEAISSHFQPLSRYWLALRNGESHLQRKYRRERVYFGCVSAFVFPSGRSERGFSRGWVLTSWHQQLNTDPVLLQKVTQILLGVFPFAPLSRGLGLPLIINILVRIDIINISVFYTCTISAMS